ncbi:MAG: cytochrome c, partial [Saprospiraceae bacterium]
MKSLIQALTVISCSLLISCTSSDSNVNKVLVFSKTEGFRHESIPQGIEMIKKLGAENGYSVDATEDASWFTQATLKEYKVVIFMSTTGDVLDNIQQLEFQRFIQGGGGYVGVHAAADTEYDWPWYGKMVGGYFESHPSDPNVRDATIHKTEHQHPSTDHLDQSWDRTDEWYSYKKLNMEVTPLLLLDETTYEGGTNGDYHPIALYHEYDGGRAFYTGGGHTNESFVEPDFVKHVSEGILWAQGDQKPINYDL